MNTWIAGYDIAVLTPGRGYLDLKIDSLNFMPGQYYLSLWIERHGEYVLTLIERVVVALRM